MIQAQRLCRFYSLGSAKVVGVSEVDLEIAGGEFVVLKGNSGSGKSTLLSLLAGLDRPSAGELRVGGHDLNRATEAQLTGFRRSVVGMVFQSFNLLPTLSVLENACLPALLAGKPFQAVRKRAEELMAWLDLRHRGSHLPAQLSGGEMQRCAIARALINDPAMILADEPTGNLDSRNGEAVVDLLASLHRTQHRTVIVATHSGLADSVATVHLRLKDGRIVG
jgi:ABC-type lipoprotein export system ATPase subunit